MPLYHTASETFRPAPESAQRFTILLFESGGGVPGYGLRRRQVTALSVFCLNEHEQPMLDPAPSGAKAQAVYFHPRVIHEEFVMGIVHAQSENPRRQDQTWLQPFVVRSDGCPGLIHLGPGPAVRLSAWFSPLGSEPDSQTDSGWPCSSRSYFFEILFLIHRIFESGRFFRPDIPTIGPLSGVDPETMTSAVIRYLHMHFPEKIPLKKVARIFYTNRTTLERRFREATGLPVMAFLTRIRVQLAALLLSDTELPIQAVAAQEDKAGRIRALVEGGAAIDAVDAVADHNNTAFGWAVYLGNLQAVEELIALGTDINFIPGGSGDTPVVSAVRTHRVEALKLLIEAKADVNIPNKSGKTALYYARLSGNEEILALLEAAGAKE